MKRVKGFTLIEILIAVTISMFVVVSMTRLMVNTLNTGTTTIEMSRLTQQLRSALELMARDVRRTSYSSEAVLCYANLDCRTDGSLNLPGDISFNPGGSCFIFFHDRNHDGDAVNDGAGGFRQVELSGVGVLEMWIGTGTPTCTSTSDNWQRITDSTTIDVTAFSVDDDQSFVEVIDIESGANVLQKVRKIHMRIDARLIQAPEINRVIEEVIRVRNDVVL